ncbi:MAG TPA: type I-U CRISPR-associated RAMP protein Csb1/Cas7u [Kofleriaceae bacterium]|nr:type I-U CRISPR-associated RAMP protein Csb1/Cas7u [Kofleriaceae bacterium]
MGKTLDLTALSKLVTEDGVAIRARQRLQPAGGPGDKVFPPTYATGDKNLKYATETRRIDGKDVPAVLLDSVASQANRIEESLLAAWETGALHFPVIGVDFSGNPELRDLGTITALQAPHRIADAILRDATDLDGKTLFRDLPSGRAFTDATPRNATAVYALCPTALVFGVWDSTGPKGGLGAKFARALTSEIVALGVQTGRKVGSRIDPLGIQANVPVYHRKDDEDDWTIDPKEAKTEKEKPVLFSRKGAEGKGKASAVNHSNVLPTIDEFAGGVTFDHAIQTVVLSLPALRRLRFVTGLDGKPLADRAAAEKAARVALAALALAGIVHQRVQGYDLRSRCLLVPDGALVLEIVRADGSCEQVSLDVEGVNALAKDAHAAAKAAGMGWEREPLKLRPAPKLVALIKRSRAEAAAGAADEV